jgi:hypothetical protein
MRAAAAMTAITKIVRSFSRIFMTAWRVADERERLI